MNQDKWTQQLHDKLAEHETAAPEGLWADIEAALEQAPSSLPSRGRLLKSRFMWRWVAAAAVAALSLGGGYLWWSQTEEPLLSQADYVVEDLNTNLAKQVSEEMKEPVTEAVVEEIAKPMKREKRPLVKRENRPLVQKQPPSAQLTMQQADDLSVEETSPTPPAQKAKETAEASTKAERSSHLEDAYRPVSEITMGTTRKPKRALTLGLYAMNGLNNQTIRNGVLMSDAMAKQFEKTYENSFISAARSSEPIYLTGYEERQHYHRPISYGLTLAYPFTERLSLTSGIVYTKLVSDFTQVMRSQQIDQQQTLHYVGVPVGLICRLWAWKGFRTYVSAGTLAYWNVATRVVTEGVTQKMERDRMQWSFNSSVGAQYDVLPQFGLYIEPGLSYYPDNGSHLQNFFKDKPLNLSLQVGLRVNFNR